MAKKTLSTLTLIFFIGLLIGCVSRFIPIPVTEEVCFATTGERDYHVDVVLSPAKALYPGQSVQIRFTGGYYLILPSCQIVDGEYVYHYPTIKELSENPRVVDVLLDGVPIHSQDCKYLCELSFSLPESIQDGIHNLQINAREWSYQPKELEFEIMVGD
jgi:hypothetical protein